MLPLCLLILCAGFAYKAEYKHTTVWASISLRNVISVQSTHPGGLPTQTDAPTHPTQLPQLMCRDDKLTAKGGHWASSSSSPSKQALSVSLLMSSFVAERRKDFLFQTVGRCNHACSSGQPCSTLPPLPQCPKASGEPQGGIHTYWNAQVICLSSCLLHGCNWENVFPGGRTRYTKIHFPHCE